MRTLTIQLRSIYFRALQYLACVSLALSTLFARCPVEYHVSSKNCSPPSYTYCIHSILDPRHAT